MWKDEYRIGVDVIDKQHQSLFEKTSELEQSIELGVKENKTTIIDTILFLKDYALNHFSDEENYSKSINYSGFDEHLAQHKAFIQTLLQHERDMKGSDFDENSVRKFHQALKIWLLFHVTNSDRKIVGKEAIAHSPNSIN